ncbi:relaxase/mobilization nuclease domain-containing protein [Acinetobacter haemolyticus]|uniref:relaxase/mobilization nuclease domain-containing protein n=1 Tax=Acinetobacter haemolyticus TaxID=29430 RepID=UPI001331D564|nr:hypothetical protein [Acinetobacter haemolyticus]QHI18455.1 hypothetical protein AhaeAN4_18065 [Acinetobacter haemolyticus]
MYIKFLKHGQGSPSKAAGYLVDEKDHLDRPRQDVQVLCGDPQTFTAIAESIQNEWKYTSGVIAWSKSDNPTDEQIKEVLEAFERHAFAGLEPSQYHMTAVLHEEDDGSKHVHFLVPRVELETGKALNIAPPNHQKYYDPLRDHFNYKNGWDRPDGIALQRDTQQPNHEHFIDKAAIRAGLKDRPVKDVRELVGDFLEQRIEHGFIRNRSDVVDALKELGEVTRQGKDYISLKIDEESKAIRLKGAFYEQEFSIKSYIEDRARTANDAGTSREFRAVSADHQKRAEQCREEFTRLATKRSEYNAERYQRPERDNTGLELNQEREQHNSQSYQRGGQDSTNSVKPTEAEFTAFDGGLRGLERQEQRSRQDDQNQKKSSDNQYHFVSTSSDFFHQQHLFWLRQQEQIRRHKRDANKGGLVEITGGEHEYSEMRNREKMEVVRTDRPEGRRVQQQYANSAGNQLNESRSTVIADYRAATAAAQRATEAARASLAAYSGTEQNHRRIRELQQQTGEALQPVERERKRADQYHQETTESEVIRGFITKLGEQLKTAITEPFRAISDWVKSKERDQRTIANDDLYRNREADSTIDRTASKETRLGEQLSRKISGFSTDPIFKALDEIDRRRDLQRVQERKNDRGYDSPSPF